MRLLSSDLIRRSTVVAVGSQLSGAEATKLADDQPSVPWIASDPGEAWVEWQLPEATDLDTFAALNGVIDDGDTIRWRVAGSQAALTSAPTWDSTALEYWPDGVDPRDELVHSLVTKALPVTASFVRLDVAVAALAEVVLGNAVFGKAYQPAAPAGIPPAGIRRLPSDQPVAVETESRSEIVFASRPRRGVEVQLRHLSSSQAIAEIERIQRYVGSASNVLLVPVADTDPLLHEWMFFGRLSELAAIEPGPYLRVIDEESWGVRLQVIHRL